MSAVRLLVSAILFSFLYHSSWQKNIPGLNQENLSNLNKTLQLSISNKRNQTGHRITLFSLNNTSARLSSNWNADFKQNVHEINGVQSIYVQGAFIVSPNDLENEATIKADTFDKPSINLDSNKKPADYSLFPGIGYYKLYNSSKVTFNEALNICFNDGGHLAIINSDQEANSIKKLNAQYPTGGNYVYLGLHDRIKEGEFTTVFGQYLNATGYNKWGSGHPSLKNSCVFFDTNALLYTMTCDSRRPFLCEIPLSSVKV